MGTQVGTLVQNSSDSPCTMQECGMLKAERQRKKREKKHGKLLVTNNSHV